MGRVYEEYDGKRSIDIIGPGGKALENVDIHAEYALTSSTYEDTFAARKITYSSKYQRVEK